MSGFKRFDECDALFRNSKGKTRPTPEVLAELPRVPVADTHCHLGMLPNPALALARAAVHGVDFICCVADPSEKPQQDDEDHARISAVQTYEALPLWRAQTAKILDVWGESSCGLPEVRYAVGVHPHNARFWEQSRESLMLLLERPETCCLGEIGLDYHYDFSPREKQRAVFAEQLDMAKRLGLPVSLHIREAHAEALEILRDVGMPAAGCILHCFNLGPDDLAPFLELGCYIAFGGPLTFKKSDYVREASRMVPLDRLLTETDAPYMAPEPLRGTVCTPDMTIFTLAMLLESIGGGEEAARRIFQNAVALLDGERG